MTYPISLVEVNLDEKAEASEVLADVFGAAYTDQLFVVFQRVSGSVMGPVVVGVVGAKLLLIGV